MLRSLPDASLAANGRPLMMAAAEARLTFDAGTHFVLCAGEQHCRHLPKPPPAQFLYRYRRSQQQQVRVGRRPRGYGRELPRHPC